MIVVNVIVYLLTETPHRELARRVRERDGGSVAYVGRRLPAPPRLFT